MDGLLWQPLLVCAHNAAEDIKLRVHLQSRDTFCSDTLYVSTDPGSLPSLTEECSFGNLSSDSYH